MRQLYIAFTSWVLGIVVSIIVLYLFCYNEPQGDRFIFTQVELDEHDKVLTMKAIRTFVEYRSLAVAKRRHEITMQQKGLLGE